MGIELGGFAEEPVYVSDAYTEEEQMRDYEAFNYCLAEDYVGAMIQEDFEALGEVDDYLFNNICEWINYNPNLGNEELEKSIKNGSLITKKDRTFLSAIAESRNIDWGELYTNIGIYSPDVIVMLIECAGEGKKVTPICIKTNSQEELDEIYRGICIEIEAGYQKSHQSIEYLRKIKKGIGILYLPKVLVKPSIPAGLVWPNILRRTP